MAWGNYELLRPSQIEAIRDETPIAYVPWGALEWHSYHNPVGLDGLKAHGLCGALAQRTGGVVLPAFYIGTDTIKPFKGFHRYTLDHRESTVQLACARNCLTQLADEALPGDCPCHRPLWARTCSSTQRDGCAEFSAKSPDIKVRGLIADWEPVEGKFEGNHAARGETAYQMLFPS